jgi:hypothetical protein
MNKTIAASGISAAAILFAPVASAAIVDVMTHAEAIVTGGTASPRPVLDSEFTDGAATAAAAASAGTVSVWSSVAVAGGAEQAMVTFDDGTLVSADTFDSGWRRDAYAAITYAALADGEMKYSWDLSFSKDYFGYAGGFTVAVCLACQPFLQVIDNHNIKTGSSHTGSGRFALSGGQTYRFFVREWTSSDGFQADRVFGATGTIGLEFPGTAPVPLPAGAPLMAAALAALGVTARRSRRTEPRA